MCETDEIMFVRWLIGHIGSSRGSEEEENREKVGLQFQFQFGKKGAIGNEHVRIKEVDHF